MEQLFAVLEFQGVEVGFAIVEQHLTYETATEKYDTDKYAIVPQSLIDEI
jgi:hypothetical protein